MGWTLSTFVHPYSPSHESANRSRSPRSPQTTVDLAGGGHTVNGLGEVAAVRGKPPLCGWCCAGASPPEAMKLSGDNADDPFDGGVGLHGLGFDGADALVVPPALDLPARARAASCSWYAGCGCRGRPSITTPANSQSSMVDLAAVVRAAPGRPASSVRHSGRCPSRAASAACPRSTRRRGYRSTSWAAAWAGSSITVCSLGQRALIVDTVEPLRVVGVAHLVRPGSSVGSHTNRCGTPESAASKVRRPVRAGSPPPCRAGTSGREC